jgi:hypothetical protein
MATSFVMSFLVPMFKKGAAGFGDELQKDVAGSAASGIVKTVQGLWARVKGAPRSKDDQDMVSLFERKPDALRDAVTEIVQQQLEQDEGFRKDVAALLEGEAKPGTANWQLVGNIVGAVDARHASVSGHGTMAGVVYHAGGQPAAEAGQPTGEAGQE